MATFQYKQYSIHSAPTSESIPISFGNMNVIKINQLEILLDEAEFTKIEDSDKYLRLCIVINHEQSEDQQNNGKKYMGYLQYKLRNNYIITKSTGFLAQNHISNFNITIELQDIRADHKPIQILPITTYLDLELCASNLNGPNVLDCALLMRY
jgi:hypothetical protein